MCAEPFENVKDQIGFCGIWCGSCMGGNGAIQAQARKFEDMVKNSKLEENPWVPKNFDFKEFMKGFASIQSMSLCPGCLKGGGPSNCEIRLCALRKNMVNCGECNQLTECAKFAQLEESHPKIREGLMEIKNMGRSKLVEKWMGELSGKWPYCVLLCGATKK